MPIHAMLDIETLGVKTRAPVLSAGVEFFDPHLNLRFEKELFLFDPEQQRGRHIQFSTMKWWMQQDRAAQAHWRDAEFPKVSFELERFVRFGETHGDVIWWAVGPHFDMTIMETLLEDFGLRTPWKFWNVRDVRTVREWINDSAVPANTNAHDPLADCDKQIHQVVAFYELMGQGAEMVVA